jgi:hypothetical protein
VIGVVVVVAVEVEVEDLRIGVIPVIHMLILVEWTHVILEILVMLGQLILVICEETHVIPEVE